MFHPQSFVTSCFSSRIQPDLSFHENDDDPHSSLLCGGLTHNIANKFGSTVKSYVNVQDWEQYTDLEFEQHQLKRLTSWDTIGTTDTIGTIHTNDRKDATGITTGDSNGKAVTFEYPPISSLKECPRITDDEREHLFF